MKKIVIIFGWHIKGLDYFLKVSSKKCNLFDEIYGFEAIPINIENEKKYCIDKYNLDEDKIKLYNSAIWIDNKGITIYDATTDEEKKTGMSSSSIYNTKTTGCFKNSFNVNSIDIIEFLNKFPKNEYEIYMSMNIEGAEFDIIDKLFETNIFDKINVREFYLDNHTNIKNEEINLKNKVKQNHIKFKKYFRFSSGRPHSGNPEDFKYYN